MHAGQEIMTKLDKLEKENKELKEEVRGFRFLFQQIKTDPEGILFVINLMMKD